MRDEGAIVAKTLPRGLLGEGSRLSRRGELQSRPRAGTIQARLFPEKSHSISPTGWVSRGDQRTTEKGEWLGGRSIKAARGRPLPLQRSYSG
jgi:hypothetical protein